MTPADPARTPPPGDSVAADHIAAAPLAATPLAADRMAATPLAADWMAATPLAADRMAATPLAADRAPADDRGPAAAPVQNGAAALRGPDLPAAPLVLYDGDCGFCARSVQWILAHELDHDILFAPLQGATAARARERYPGIPQSIDSVVYIHHGRAHLRSKAMLHAARHIRPPWRWVYALRWFPASLLDLGYRALAAVRYRIWGHADACRLVTPEQRRRFLA